MTIEMPTLHVYSVEITRNTREKDPLCVAADALRQAQAESCILNYINNEDLTSTEAGYFYTTHGAYIDLTLWCNSKMDLRDVLTMMQDLYGFDAIQLTGAMQTSPRGAFDDR